jgi:hypothetical protein
VELHASRAAITAPTHVRIVKTRLTFIDPPLQPPHFAPKKKTLQSDTSPPYNQRTMPTSKKKKMPEELPQDAESLARLLEKSWPAKKSKEITKLFSALRKALKQKQTPPPKVTGEVKKPQFDVLDLLRRTLTAHDLLFLRRQITYHLAASAGLPLVFAEFDRVQMATAKLLEYMAKRAPRNSRISVQLGEIPLRTGMGIEVSFTGTDDSLTTVDKAAFAQRMFKAEDDEGQILVACREIVASQGGQMWADLPQQIRHQEEPGPGGTDRDVCPSAGTPSPGHRDRCSREGSHHYHIRDSQGRRAVGGRAHLAAPRFRGISHRKEDRGTIIQIQPFPALNDQT